ncbi:MAG TPA: DivIVA domain-containing protein [Gaiellaceae bacterium]|nr:DivIVA domain-containing protein [Gaiellaceae bacterium]
MSIQPEDLTVSGLPRSPLPGGIKADAAADLLQRAAWDYSTVLAQARQLAETVEEQARRIEELEAQIASLEAEAAARKDPDELAHRLLASAHRTAREEREEARRESELLLKKAERRAERIEQEARRRVEGEISQLEQLNALRQELSGGLRSTLEAIVALGSDGGFTPERA